MKQATLCALVIAGCTTPEPITFNENVIQGGEIEGEFNEDAIRYTAVQDARVSHQYPYVALDAKPHANNPSKPYSPSCYVGASVELVGEGDEKKPVAHPDRCLIGFDPSLDDLLNNHGVTAAELTFYTTSGTCFSSKDKNICDRPLVVYACWVPFREINKETYSEVVGRGNLDSDCPKLGSITVQESYRDPNTGGTPYVMPIDALPLKIHLIGSTLMLRANDAGELRLSHEDAIWYNQTDVSLGSTETGLPAVLTVLLQ